MAFHLPIKLIIVELSGVAMAFCRLLKSSVKLVKRQCQEGLGPPVRHLSLPPNIEIGLSSERLKAATWSPKRIRHMWNQNNDWKGLIGLIEGPEWVSKLSYNKRLFRLFPGLQNGPLLKLANLMTLIWRPSPLSSPFLHCPYVMLSSFFYNY